MVTNKKAKGFFARGMRWHSPVLSYLEKPVIEAAVIKKTDYIWLIAKKEYILYNKMAKILERRWIDDIRKGGGN